MTAKYFLSFLFFQGLIFFSPISAQKLTSIKWSVAAELPAPGKENKNPGVAGAFAGIHNNVLLIAGGANFPDAMPWNGGKKIYWEDVYVLKNKKNRNFEWYTEKKFFLKKRTAYGASVSTTEGIVCIGGENENGLSEEVFILQWDEINRKIVQKDLPELPLALTNAAAALYVNTIFLAGGESINGVSDKFYSLDLDNISTGWKQLPTIPVAVSHAVLTVQSDGQNMSVYLVGGRKRNANGISDLYSSVFEFNLDKNKWNKKTSLPFALSAAAGVATGENEILIFGGDKGEIFHQVELLISAISIEKNETKKQELIQQKNQLQSSHPGFSKEVLMYNTLKDEWKQIGKIPYETPVTTTAIKWENRIFLPSGEIKAGIRTPQVLLGKFNFKIK